MQTKTSVLLKVLLNKYRPGPPLPFLKAIDQDAAKEIAAADTNSDDVDVSLSWPLKAIELTHYSWFVPVIEKMPEGLRYQTIGALNPSQKIGICKILKIKNIPSVPSVIHNFFLNKLYSAWDQKDALPSEYLPKSALEQLLSLSKAELVSIIDLLAIYDLSDALRHIVDKNKLKKVYQCLNLRKQQFLRQCLHKKEKLGAPKLDIDKWDGNVETLNNLLHRRGILRLGKILCGQSKQFMWHIVHRLDVGRGKSILEHYQEIEIANITSLLTQQLFSVINFLKKEG